MDEDIIGIMATPGTSTWDQRPTLTPVEAIRVAIEKIRTATYEPDEMFPLSPWAHDEANRLLGRPSGTSLSYSDLADAVAIEWRLADEARAATRARHRAVMRHIWRVRRGRA